MLEDKSQVARTERPTCKDIFASLKPVKLRTSTSGSSHPTSHTQRKEEGEEIVAEV